MRHFFGRFQLLLVSMVLLATFALMMVIMIRFNQRWDITQEKIYSISKTTSNLLTQMNKGPVEVIAFYPSNDSRRDDFEIFLKESQLLHPNFEYSFYDPNRRPQLAKYWRIKELYTVIIRYQMRQERVIMPSEEHFASALLRLINPKVTPVCLLPTNNPRGMLDDDEKSLSYFHELLEDNNYPVQDVASASQIPATCKVLIVPGPQKDWAADEVNRIGEVLAGGTGVLFLIDPMDPGTGNVFYEFLAKHGVQLGEDVIVDKMSRMVGGDFLVPFVSNYSDKTGALARFDQPTFFPVARSLRPTNKPVSGIKVEPIAFTGSNSWAETSLEALEKGEAVFETETDYPGPVPIAVALEKDALQKPLGKTNMGRMVVVGDSDFITNAYLPLSGNQDFAMKLLRWVSFDNRELLFNHKDSNFEPLFLDENQRLVMLSLTLLGIPLILLVIGLIQNIWRKQTA